MKIIGECISVANVDIWRGSVLCIMESGADIRVPMNKILKTSSRAKEEKKVQDKLEEINPEVGLAYIYQFKSNDGLLGTLGSLQPIKYIFNTCKIRDI